MRDFPPYSHNKNKIEAELDLSTYATKSDLKTQQVSIHHNFFLNYLANLKLEVDKLDIDKLEKVPSGLNSLKSKID